MTSLAPDVVTFHVRYTEYGSRERSQEFGTIKEAVAFAYYHFEWGLSAEQEVWSADERIMDTDQIIFPSADKEPSE